jgi:hypothetical protein
VPSNDVAAPDKAHIALGLGEGSGLADSILLPELLSSDDGTCRCLPFCAVARVLVGL